MAVDWFKILKSLDKVPGGPEWITRNREEVARRVNWSPPRSLTSESYMAKLPELTRLREKYNLPEKR